MTFLLFWRDIQIRKMRSSIWFGVEGERRRWRETKERRDKIHEGGDLVQGSFESFEIDSTQVAQVQ